MNGGVANGYTCKSCGQVTMTYKVDEGVTPMFLRCRATEGCNGEAVSMMYPPGQVPAHLAGLPRWEWYRPSPRQTERMSAAMRDHIERGGLALRGPC
ncbi:MAG TPA: hypothetical protein VK735_32595 [Pseudonocardia sp.]|uniref:hypothetical protein n=1 Tax=Pseudonocardia sp. TaxID=60912 RepID=UPI002CF977F9|nr:hypothetical protein [Pseudonocardia sp.]HTF52208.1 hypothetical protein [Pseudonocardia sp.]